MAIPRKAITIAKKVRAEAEQVEKQEDGMGACQGLCARATAELHRRLSAEGFTPEIGIHRNYNIAHAFIVLEDTILDITATQFGHPKKVATGKIGERAEWKFSRVVPDPGALLKYQKHVGWTDPYQMVRERGV